MGDNKKGRRRDLFLLYWRKNLSSTARYEPRAERRPPFLAAMVEREEDQSGQQHRCDYEV
jgi:hypothetical protein